MRDKKRLLRQAKGGVGMEELIDAAKGMTATQIARVGNVNLKEVVDALEEFRREGWLIRDLKGRYKATPKGREIMSKIFALSIELEERGYKQPCRTKEFQERAEKLVSELEDAERVFG